MNIKIEKLFSEALGIEHPWKIQSVYFDSVNKRLDIDVRFERGSTFPYVDPENPECTEHCKAYDTVDKTWRHLNFFEHECYLNTKVPRIQPRSGGTKMILPPWAGVVAGFTLMFEAFALQLCRNMPVNQVSKLLSTTDHKLWTMMDGYVFKALMTQDLADVRSVGTDETSIAKNHDYISLFVDLEQKKTVFITDGKSSKTVEMFAQNIEDCGGDRHQIKDVSCDMSPAFIKGVRESLPSAQITFDKFHLIKVINKGVDEVRRSEVKTTPALRGARYALTKNSENLTVKQQEIKQRLSLMNLKSMKALHLRENFQAIYKAESMESFKALLQEWYIWATHSQLPPMVKAAQTIKKHWDGVIRWQETQISNGILEGFNSIIQAAKRKARGYKIEHFKTMAYLLTGKFNLREFNPHLPTRF